jgi:predicted nucleotidyltransferase
MKALMPAKLIRTLLPSPDLQLRGGAGGMIPMQPAPIGDDILAKLKGALGELVERLRTGLGDELISVVLFGGAARGRFDPAVSDANVMIVLRTVTIDILDRIGTAADPFRRMFQLSLLTVTESDLPDSVEVFPTKFLDIQRHHEILWGKDVTTAFEVPRDRLERHALRQLMNLHLRLRQVYLEARTRPEQLDGMIRRSVSTLLLQLGILLELKMGKVCESTEDVLEAAAAAHLDRGKIAEFIEFKYGRREVDADALPSFYGAFMQEVEAVMKLGGVR